MILLPAIGFSIVYIYLKLKNESCPNISPQVNAHMVSLDFLFGTYL